MGLVRLIVNGTTHELEVDAEARLLSVLRDGLALTGTKYGCGEGQCGACTVLVGDRAVRSCLVPAASLAGERITTIEGLGRGDGLHPVQQSFLDAGALQCGYCTPGMIMSAVALLKSTPHLDRPQIVRAMNGNVCRCGAYARIVRAIELASAQTLETSAGGSGR